MLTAARKLIQRVVQVGGGRIDALVPVELVHLLETPQHVLSQSQNQTTAVDNTEADRSFFRRL